MTPATKPVVAEGLLLLSSSCTDSLTAYDIKTGSQLWECRANGPLQFTPAISDQSVCLGSDNGVLYCGKLQTDELIWKLRSVPSQRLVLGNRRLISMWPVRGGQLVAEGNVYFATGTGPFEGIFVYAVEIALGKLI
ncbi:MAG: PQQ-binding-like beta-propeller repeat protein [Pirellulaceae bacterium]|nr:PQQ-binding-like beta-propeller repeat protein [Pirellulaceae bacterium]